VVPSAACSTCARFLAPARVGLYSSDEPRRLALLARSIVVPSSRGNPSVPSSRTVCSNSSVPSSCAVCSNPAVRSMRGRLTLARVVLAVGPWSPFPASAMLGGSIAYSLAAEESSLHCPSTISVRIALVGCFLAFLASGFRCLGDANARSKQLKTSGKVICVEMTEMGSRCQRVMGRWRLKPRVVAQSCGQLELMSSFILDSRLALRRLRRIQCKNQYEAKRAKRS